MMNIFKIQKGFFSGLPINEYFTVKLLENIFNNSDEETSTKVQQEIIEATVNHPLNQKHQYKYSYQKQFLKTLINFLTDNQHLIDDSLYDAFGRLVSVNENDQDFLYKQYFINERETIVLQESGCLIEQGSTGLRTWQAGLALAEFCVQNKNHFIGKSIVELGCGVGLTGIACLLTSNEIQKYCFTDCHHQVLERLITNLKLNFDLKGTFKPENSLLLNAHLQNTKINVTPLEWQEFDRNTLLQLIGLNSTDDILILGADIVFNKSQFVHLVNVIYEFLNFSPKVEILIASTVRSEETYASFKNSLDRKQTLIIEEFDAPKPSLFIWSSDCPIKFLRIFNSK